MNFQIRSRKENVTYFITTTREKNPEKRIVIILDNFRSHHSRIVLKTAELLNINLIFRSPYSFYLNPIEFNWKSIRRVLSVEAIDSEEKLKDTIKKSFLKLSGRLIFAKRWTEKILNKSIMVKIIKIHRSMISLLLISVYFLQFGFVYLSTPGFW